MFLRDSFQSYSAASPRILHCDFRERAKFALRWRRYNPLPLSAANSATSLDHGRSIFAESSTLPSRTETYWSLLVPIKDCSFFVRLASASDGKWPARTSLAAPFIRLPTTIATDGIASG